MKEPSGKVVKIMQDNIFLRPMTKADVRAVAMIEKACFRTPWTERMLLSDLKNDVSQYFVAEDDAKEMLAYLGMWILFDEAHITNVAVMPKFRRQGIAKKIMLHGMQNAISLGATQMTLEVRETNAGAQALYFGMDFVSAGRRKKYYTDTGEDALILWNMDIQKTLERLQA